MDKRGETSQWPDGALIEECGARATALLKANLSPHGIFAATPTRRAREKRYDAVFGRDAAICALAMARSADAELVEGARLSLATLARHQADNGQIPKFVRPREREVDFWYVGCIDATLWWLIAAHQYVRLTGDVAFERAFADTIARGLNWLRCQEHPKLGLVSQNEASDWADVMPRSGYVLYSNALWYYVKRLYHLPGSRETHRHFNHLFFPFAGDLPEYRRLRLLGHFVRRKARDRDLFLSFVNFSFWGEEGDVLGNLLAVLLGLASEARARAIVRALRCADIERPVPVRVTLSPIEPGSPLWRAYMRRHRQNLAHQYHNGGCWPFVGGFWVMTLAALGEKAKAQAALAQLAQANAVGGWAFNEWFHGQTGEPMGMTGQSWNAAAFLLAQASLQGRVF
ncbi:amylo-alpha-1,6-glucosidase [Pelomicrobium methylotrophicum]|uniref:beta-fructofuranosidase n=1 Tax=Pelomicrobium methylotrophicum TaxID=2602750 RepID=A0A5C7EKG9_9PROT|nr:glycoside hydrolase 100 family protein [Pelomicrobium methylotrophicum]TXF11981.1 glycoside hydrolase [Pelomicrobium methylotrophicum]